MKNLILLCFVSILCLQSFSQRTSKNDFEKERFFRFGLKASINVNNVEGRSFKDEFRFNYGVGGFVQLNFSRKLGLQPEVNYVQSSAEQTNDFSEIYDDIALGGDQLKAKLNYLKFSGLLNLNVGPTQKVKLQFGPQWGLLLNQKVDSTTTNDIFKKGDFSLAGGLMLQLPLIHFGGRYEQGLTNINGIDNQDKWKSRAWQIFVGVTF